MNIGIILGGGVGLRFGASIPKYFTKIHGKPCFRYIIDSMKSSGVFDLIISVITSPKYNYIVNDTIIAYGGKTRNLSIKNALSVIKKYRPKNILFHDAARPLFFASDFKQYFDELNSGNKSIVTAQKITDSLYTGNRDKNYLIQTPEAFDYQHLIKYFNPFSKKTAIFAHLPNKPKLLFIKNPNTKITNQWDLFSIEGILKYDNVFFTPISADLSKINKTVLILGASGGLGTSIKNYLQKFGNLKLFCPSHSEFDLTSSYINILNKLHSINPDVIINCAGVAIANMGEEIIMDNNIFKINYLFNVYLLSALKALSFYYQKPINVTLIGSSSVTKGRKNEALYSASKSALISHIESTSEELSKNNIFVNCVCPERINTPLNHILHPNSSMCELLDPDKLAKYILDVSFSSGIYGKILHIRKGFNNDF